MGIGYILYFRSNRRLWIIVTSASIFFLVEALRLSQQFSVMLERFPGLNQY